MSDTKQELREKQTHGHVIILMDELGYGLMKDGKTFYKKGYELDPYLVETFSMYKAYEVHRLFNNEKRNTYKDEAVAKRIESIVEYVNGCTKFHGDMFSAQKQEVAERIEEMFRQLLTDTVKAEVNKTQEQYDEIFKWLFGEVGDFPPSEPGKRYAWRTELRKKLSAIEQVRKEWS